MFAKLLGPKDVIAFNPEWYVRKWLASGWHSADDTASSKRDLTNRSQVTTAMYARFSNDINFIK